MPQASTLSLYLFVCLRREERRWHSISEAVANTQEGQLDVHFISSRFASFLRPNHFAPSSSISLPLVLVEETACSRPGDRKGCSCCWKRDASLGAYDSSQQATQAVKLITLDRVSAWRLPFCLVSARLLFSTEGDQQILRPADGDNAEHAPCRPASAVSYVILLQQCIDSPPRLELCTDCTDHIILLHLPDRGSLDSKSDDMADEYDETELVIDSPDQEPMEDEDLPEPDQLDLNNGTARTTRDKDANREQVRQMVFVSAPPRLIQPHPRSFLPTLRACRIAVRASERWTTSSTGSSSV